MNLGFSISTYAKTYMNMRFLLFGIIALLSSCHTQNTQNTEDTSDNSTSQNNSLDTGKSRDIYTRAAIETCNCFSDLLEKAHQLEVARKEKHEVVQSQISKEIVTMRPQVQSCSDSIYERYTAIQSTAAKKKVFNIMQKHCPAVADFFSMHITERR
jgi:hypothetical protein